MEMKGKDWTNKTQTGHAVLGLVPYGVDFNMKSNTVHTMGENTKNWTGCWLLLV